MGECDLRYFYLPGVLGQASKPGRSPELCPLDHIGQVEGQRAREDESGRQWQGEGLLRLAARLQAWYESAAEVQLQGGCSLPKQGRKCTNLYKNAHQNIKFL
jgi:hypothetical protein